MILKSCTILVKELDQLLLMSIDEINRHRQSYKDSSASTRNIQLESYLERQYHSMKQVRQDYLNTLTHLSNRGMKTDVIKHLLRAADELYNNLLAYCEGLPPLENFPHLSIIHSSLYSHSSLLALYFAKEEGLKVTLVTFSRKSFISVSVIMAPEDELDKVGYCRQVLRRQGVKLLDLAEEGAQHWKMQSYGPEDVLLIDLVDVQAGYFLPLLMTHLPSLGESAKLITYSNYIQQPAVQQLRAYLQLSRIDLLRVELQTGHPIESVFCDEEEQLEDQIIEFLQQYAHFPAKIDIAIFYPLSSSQHRYVAKLKERIMKQGLKDRVNLIVKKGVKVIEQQINIFIAKGVQEIDSWGYDLNRIRFVIDYCQQQTFGFNYQLSCYSSSTSMLTRAEKAKRLSLLGTDSLGKYFALRRDLQAICHYTESEQEISTFIVLMIKNNRTQYLVMTQRVKQCLSFLKDTKIIHETEGKYHINDERFWQFGQKGVSPLDCNLILSIQDNEALKPQEKEKYINLMAIALSVIKNPGSLRQVRQELEGSHVKPYPVWRKSGYLESCLQVMTKCGLIEHRKIKSRSKSHDHRKKSKANQNMLINTTTRRKLKFEDMQVDDLIKEYTVNEELFYAIREQVDRLLMEFNVGQVPILLEKEDTVFTINALMESHPKAVGVYVGSHQKLFQFGKTHHFRLHESNLARILNQHPEVVLMLRLDENHEGKTVFLSNNVTEQQYERFFGKLVVNRVQSRAEQVQEQQGQTQEQMKVVEQQLQFQHLSSAILNELTRDDGEGIEQFEDEFDCLVVVNLALGRAVVHVYKQSQEPRGKHVKLQFNLLLKRLKEKCVKFTKTIHYMGSLSLVLGKGGNIVELIEKGYTNKCILKNLPKEIPRQYLQVVLQDFVVKRIEVLESNEYQGSTAAMVQFYSQRNYEQFRRQYNNSLQKLYSFVLEQLNEEKYYSFMGQQMRMELFEAQKFSLEFKWFVWKSHGKAQVTFESQQGAQGALEDLQNNPTLDQAQVKVTPQKDGSMTLNIEDLQSYTDQVFIRQALESYGEIKNVEILKSPLKETARDQEHLRYLMRRALGNSTDKSLKDRALNVQIGAIEKREFGMRTCRVKMESQEMMNVISSELDKAIGYFGEGRLYAQTWYEDHLLVPEGYITIYMELLEEVLEKCRANNERSRVFTKIAQIEENTYLEVKSNLREALEMVMGSMRIKLRGHLINIPFEARSILINEVGMANFVELQGAYDCKFRVSVINKQVKVVAKENQVKKIQQQVDNIVNQHFFYRVSLTGKHYKSLKNNPEELQLLEREFELRLAELETESHTLLLEGSALKVQFAINKMFKITQVEGKQGSDESANECNICCSDQIEEPFTLFCKHRFCKECIQQYLQISLGDHTMFPFLCPEINCRKPITAQDLNLLLDFEEWHRLRGITIGELLKTDQSLMYCLSPGCQQINRIQHGNVNNVPSEYIRCDVCRGAYCVKCQGKYHPARTCKEAKMSENQLLKMYMKGHDVRKCANPRCKVLVQRYTGCFKVMCSRCTTCMCFKCPPDQMTPYRTSTECYDHLSKEHGGFF